MATDMKLVQGQIDQDSEAPEDLGYVEKLLAGFLRALLEEQQGEQNGEQKGKQPGDSK